MSFTERLHNILDSFFIHTPNSCSPEEIGVQKKKTITAIKQLIRETVPKEQHCRATMNGAEYDNDFTSGFNSYLTELLKALEMEE